jgi:enoyl-CoA hydratase/carnithine racemase
MLVGWGMAKELLLTGRVVEADEAYRIGLLNRLVAPEAVVSTALEIGRQIAANHPGAVRGAKRLLHEAVGLGYRASHDAEAAARGDRFPAPPIREGFKDFIARKGI